MMGITPRCRYCYEQLTISKDKRFFICVKCTKKRAEYKYKKKSDRRLKKERK